MPFDQSDWSPESVSDSRGKEFPLSLPDADPVTGDIRDSVEAHVSPGSEPPIVSISDVHGYLDAARNALLTLADHPAYDPVVERDADGRLHWAGNEHVLVFNGDLVDRGPANVETLEMVARLLDEAPRGRVRVTLGNHEMGVLTPALFMWESMFSGQVSTDGRRNLVREILGGRIVAAYDGYNVTYAHAGHSDEYAVRKVNDDLVAAAQHIHGLIGGGADAAVQQQLVEDYPLVLGMGNHHLKGPEGGLIWIDLRHLPPDSPPQVVGHTRHDSVIQKGELICENVIRNNIDTPGGEAVLVETPDEIVALQRESNGGVTKQTFTL